MNTLQLDAEIFRNLGIIAKDETMLSKVAKYVRRLAKQMTEDPTLMTKEEFFQRVDASKEQYLRGEYTRFANKEEMHKWLNSL